MEKNIMNLTEFRNLVKDLIKEETEKKTYSVYELSLGRPGKFYNKETKTFDSDIDKASLYSQSEAKVLMGELPTSKERWLQERLVLEF